MESLSKEVTLRREKFLIHFLPRKICYQMFLKFLKSWQAVSYKLVSYIKNVYAAQLKNIVKYIGEGEKKIETNFCNIPLPTIQEGGYLKFKPARLYMLNNLLIYYHVCSINQFKSQFIIFVLGLHIQQSSKNQTISLSFMRQG